MSIKVCEIHDALREVFHKKRERELFFECLASDQAKALIYAFFAERAAAKVPGVERTTPVLPIARVAIVSGRQCPGESRRVAVRTDRRR